MVHKKKERTDLIDELRLRYDLFVEVMENPKRAGYIGLINKLKPESKEPINLKLLDKKTRIDWKIRRIIEQLEDILDRQ
ncbi:hypothetical protein LLG07_00040 [bacterium]|nr:hypothetical protein [bacterium]